MSTLRNKLRGTHKYTSLIDWMPDNIHRFTADDGEGLDEDGLIEAAAEALGEDPEDDDFAAKVYNWLDSYM